MPSGLSSAFDALKPIAGRAIETALSRLVALDPETRSALAALEGRRIQIAIAAPSLVAEIRVADGRLRVGPADGSAESDLAVHGTLGGLLAQLPFLRAKPGAGKVRIAGDADLARQLQRLAERFDPDWNLPFTDVLGDVIGVQVAQAVRAALRTGRDTALRVARHGAEYVTEESRDVVGRAELDVHLDDVDALRDRIERLAARMQALQRRLDAAETRSPSSASGGAA